MSEKNTPENEMTTEHENTVMGETKKESKPKKFRKKRKWVKWLIIAVVVISACIFVWNNDAAYSSVQGCVSFLPERATDVQSTSNYTQVPVQRRPISVTLTGSGTLQPIDSYTITSKVTGEILSADFEEMDEVEEDQVLYVIDSEDVQSSIRDYADNVEDARDALDDLLEQYEDLELYSDYGGVVEKLYVEEEDNVQSGTRIAHIIDRDTMLLEVPFFVQDIQYIKEGDAATVTVNSATDTISGVVEDIGMLESVTSVGAKTRTVTVSVKNPGGITTATTAYAEVNGLESTSQGTFKYNVDEEINIKFSGEIELINVKEGDRVKEGDLILRLSSENLDDQKEKLEKQLDKAQDSYDDFVEKLEDYTITAPISGTVVQKNYKASDNLSATGTGGNSPLAIIYDMTKLNFDLNIDEIDLSMIKEGQEVLVTSDSFDESYTGYVKKKSIIGSSSMGTTSYPVTIELDGNDVLLPGMNVNAEIYIEKVENVLAVPVEAIMRGNKVRVIRANKNADSADEAQTEDKQNGERPQMSADGERPQMSADGERPQMPEGMQMPEGGFPRGDRNGGFGQMHSNTSAVTEQDFEIVEVVTGVSDDEYVEIVSGLEDGDIVVIENTAVDTSAAVTFGGFGNMGGGSMGGGFGGNMGGGMQSRPSNMGGGFPR